ncbi:MAG: ABC transporter permease [Lachnospiraceae bacterium]|nr:ABC transporter permease [Lachnospiraceae bacterium]
MNKEKKTLIDFFANNKFIHTLLSIVIGFVVGAIFLSIMHISVGTAYGKLLSTVFNGTKGLSYCVAYATPYIVVGLSVAFSFKTGVFNIGAEGQYVMGSMAACVTAILLPNLPKPVLIPLCFIASMLVGAIWGMVVAFLKTKWGINEVLSMIMFNWIAFYLSNFIANIPAIHNDGTAEATKYISDNAKIGLSADFIKAHDLCNVTNWGILVAIVLTIIVWFIIEKTTLGYQLKAVGFNKNAAEYGGISANKSIFTALAISGMLSGLGGALQLMGMGNRISVFSGQEGYGFAGIVVALIGCSNPFGVFAAGLFYGSLRYSGGKLNLVGVPTQVVDIIIGTVVFFIAISTIFSYVKYLKKKPKEVKKVEGKEE